PQDGGGSLAEVFNLVHALDQAYAVRKIAASGSVRSTRSANPAGSAQPSASQAYSSAPTTGSRSARRSSAWGARWGTCIVTASISSGPLPLNSPPESTTGTGSSSRSKRDSKPVTQLAISSPSPAMIAAATGSR